MEIRPFKAWRFDGSVVSNVGDCLAPPYDVIDPPAQQQLYDKNPCNVVRAIKGKTGPNDSDGDNQYTRAADFLGSMIESGALKQDAKETIYGYVQDFEIAGRQFRRTGWVALAKLTAFGEDVCPHERTLDGPKADRLNLMRQTATQFGQIFMLYDDPENTAETVVNTAAARAALLDFTDNDNVRHRIYAIEEGQGINTIATMMMNKLSVIADGHHRYETALNYYAETKNPAAAYRMMTFVNMRNEGLIILPTHRLVANVADLDIDKLIATIQDDFEITKYDFGGEADKSTARDAMFGKMNDCFAKTKNAFGIYAGQNAFYVAVLKNTAAMDKDETQMSQAAKALDVNVLHKLILDGALGIGDKQLKSQSNVEYVKDIGGAIETSIARVDSGEKQAIFFMNATRIEQVKALAAAGEKMPQKSTFFYPKIYTGLLINRL